jgi:hypothetical protein
LIARCVLAYTLHRHATEKRSTEHTGQSQSQVRGIGGFLAASSLLNAATSASSSSAQTNNSGAIPREFDADGSLNDILESFQHIESPLQQLKRAGLGLLSQGLGKLGFSAAAGASTDRKFESVLVIFVVGGMSFREISQVQSVLSSSLLPQGGRYSRVILMSTHAVSPDDVTVSILSDIHSS